MNDLKNVSMSLYSLKIFNLTKNDFLFDCVFRLLTKKKYHWDYEREYYCSAFFTHFWLEQTPEAQYELS